MAGNGAGLEGGHGTHTHRPRVLVTGASGFVAGHVVATLLRHGYSVRGTVRSLARYEAAAIIDPDFLPPHTPGQLEYVEADLLDPHCWARAVDGCEYVIHVASPAPAKNPDHEDDLVKPAVNGTLHVLEACDRANVRRVVITSSSSAVYNGAPKPEAYTYSEKDWSDWSHARAYQAYTKSKTLAEREARQFVRRIAEYNVVGAAMWERLPETFDLVAMNPCFILGPLPSPRLSTSMSLVSKLLNSSMPALPDLWFNCVDVRDVAEAHVRALQAGTVSVVSGKSTQPAPQPHEGRYVLYSKLMHIQDIARVLKDEYGPQGFHIPTARLPNWVVWLIGLFDPSLRMMFPQLGVRKTLSAARASQDLGINFRPLEATLLAGANDLIRRGLATKKASWARRMAPAVILLMAVAGAAVSVRAGWVQRPVLRLPWR